jgi:HD-GYP domain-containing protein (c-di-GMP phosphodiesterase class II)
MSKPTIVDIGSEENGEVEVVVSDDDISPETPSQASTQEDNIDNIEFDNEEQFHRYIEAENDKFKLRIDQYITWLQSDPASRIWPSNNRCEKNSFRQRIKKFQYDPDLNILRRKLKNADGQCKFLKFYSYLCLKVHKVKFLINFAVDAMERCDYPRCQINLNCLVHKVKILINFAVDAMEQTLSKHVFNCFFREVPKSHH